MSLVTSAPTKTNLKITTAKTGPHFGDRAFKWLTLVMALSVFALIVLIGYELAQRRTAP